MDLCFDILLNMINGALTILNSKGFFLRDSNDKDFYLEKVYYDPEDDELYCEFLKDRFGEVIEND